MGSLYLRFAVGGIHKNRKLCYPYILTGVGMVSIFYVLNYLINCEPVMELRGSGVLTATLSFGVFVMAAFSLVFLSYTSSFLTKRRLKEYGLYNVLGMDKWGIAKISFWESVILGFASVTLGLVFGIAISKLCEVEIMNIIREDIDYTLRFYSGPFFLTLTVYGTIYILLLLKALFQVSRKNPLDMMKSESEGEKPPKGNRLIALLGFVLPAVSYYMAATIKNPVDALSTFVIAVIMVIAATYCLFTVGSVTLCKWLQKRKKYYYKKNHFISVSSMTFRMKRNGAGLASICILSTMVLVTMAGTISMYASIRDLIGPYDSSIEVRFDNLDEVLGGAGDSIKENYYGIFKEYGLKPKEETEYVHVYTNLVQRDDCFIRENAQYEDYRAVRFISAADYSRLTGEKIYLNPGEALVTQPSNEYPYSTVTIMGFTFSIPGNPPKYEEIGMNNSGTDSHITVILSNLDELQSIDGLMGENCEYCWTYSCNFDGDDDTVIAAHYDQYDALTAYFGERGYSSSGYSSREQIKDAYVVFGGLLFLGVMLSLVFLSSAVLILYYKHLTEGYEDKERISIMEKVGMTKTLVRKNVNSQILTVFLAPLIVAGIHLIFASPLIWKLLQLTDIYNFHLFIKSEIFTFALFSVCYIIAYKLTAETYLKIVGE